MWKYAPVYFKLSLIDESEFFSWLYQYFVRLLLLHLSVATIVSSIKHFIDVLVIIFFYQKSIYFIIYVFCLYYEAINIYPGVRFPNPPNVTSSDPLQDIHFKGFVQNLGYALVVFSVIITTICILSVIGTCRKAKHVITAVSFVYKPFNWLFYSFCSLRI